MIVCTSKFEFYLFELVKSYSSSKDSVKLLSMQNVYSILVNENLIHYHYYMPHILKNSCIFLYNRQIAECIYHFFQFIEDELFLDCM